MIRLILGFFVAALWLPILQYFASGVYGDFWFGVIALFTVPLTLLVAVPLFYFSRKNVTFLRCLMGGVAIGGIGVGLFLFSTNILAALNWAPLLMGTGILSAFLFWAVAVWGNSSLTLRSRGTPQKRVAP